MKVKRKTYKYFMTVSRVLDGDSFVCQPADLGHGIFLDKMTYRLFGLNAPEVHSKSKEEKARGLKVKELVQGMIEGKEVEIETIKPDKYSGRYLAIVKIGGICLNDYLLKHADTKEYYGIGIKPI